MDTLSLYGWSQLQQSYYSSREKNLLPGRVISIQGFKYYLITEKGELETELSGKLLFENENENLPKVGDWVFYIDYETMGYIVEVCPRKNALSRKTPGKKTEKQILATNIDHGIVVQGLDRDFNLMRLDRYIVQIQACGILPVILLNKSDLIQNHESVMKEIQRLQRECPVFMCSTLSGHGLAEVSEQIFKAGTTNILIGSSGVGKSSLLNALMNNASQKTAAVSDFNYKGRHTTTRRDLFVLPNGALIIDTPGMREFGLTFEDDAAEDGGFPAIQELANQCRYADCRHVNESGCAVLDALSAGALDPLIYDSYLKLIKEQRRFQISADEKKQQAKMFGRMTREAKNYRKKYKY